MNNKGFAITTILFGLVLIFSMLLMSLLGTLSIYRSNMEKLAEGVNGTGGARNMVIKRPVKKDTSGNAFTSESQVSNYAKSNGSGVYCYIEEKINEKCYYYTGNGDK